MENTSQATFESVWAMFAESERLRQESERFLTEKQAETDRLIKEVGEKQMETDRQMAATDRKIAKTERLVKNIGKTLGGMGNSHGDFAEEYFFNAFEDGETNFFGEKFDKISKNLKYQLNGLEDEYDVVMFNHSSVAIVESKYRARKEDLPSVLKKVDTFRILFPHYKNYKIYLGYAAMSFTRDIEQEFEDNGIAVIKQVGDKVIINENKLKTF